MNEKTNDIQEPTEINFKEPIIKFYRKIGKICIFC